MFFKTLEKSKITSKFNSLIIEKMIEYKFGFGKIGRIKIYVKILIPRLKILFQLFVILLSNVSINISKLTFKFKRNCTNSSLNPINPKN